MIRLFIKSNGLKHLSRPYALFEFSTTNKQSQPKSVENTLDKKGESKISVKHFLRYELTQNPEFDKAFPNLAKYKPSTTIKDKKEELDFIESLE